MSTKTSIKRVALVAVAALALGGFTAVSAKAQSVAQSYLYCSKADGGAISNTATTGATCSGVAGPNNTVTVTGAQTTKDLSITVSGAGATLNTSSNWTLNSTTAATSASVAAANAGGSITINTPQVGTITVTIYTATAGSGIYTLSTETVVITVGATATSGVYSAGTSTAYIVAGETVTASADASPAISAQKTYTATDSATASIVIKYLDANSAGVRDTITATVTSGGGALASQAQTGKSNLEGASAIVFDSRTVLVGAARVAGDSAGPVNASTSNGNYSTSLYTDKNGLVGFFVFANGQAGVSTITIKNSAGTVIATKSLTFTGTDVSSITLKVLKSSVNGDTASGATSGVLQATLKDSAGNLVVGKAWSPTVTYSSSVLGAYRTNGGAGNDTTTSDSSGNVTYGWTAPSTVAYGPVTVTFTDAATGATASGVVTVSSAVAATFVVTAPASVDLGNPFTYTVTAKDANGYNVPDGAVASNYISSVTQNAGIGASTSPDLTLTTATAGAWTLKYSGPTVAAATGKADFLLTGTAGTANSYLAKTLTATTVSSSFAITGGGTSGGDAALALDAANAATDAANNAYDEAQNATQAAQDALAAVTALAKQVSSLIASVKSLTALVSKIKAKVGA